MDIILGDWRCGGNILRRTLNQHPEINFLGEILNLGRGEYPKDVVAHIRRRCRNATGFHLQRSQIRDDFDWVRIAEMQPRIIDLRRYNLVDQYKSWKVACANGGWLERAAPPKLRWNQQECEAMGKWWTDRRDLVEGYLSGCSTIKIAFEDIETDFKSVIQRVLRFLGHRDVGLVASHERPPKYDYDKIFFDMGTPATATVISAADMRYLPGAYLMAWTLLRQNHVQVEVYDYGIERNCKMAREMESWGVGFREAPVLVPDSVRGWQTFNKPVLIDDAIKRHSQILWIDADIAIAGSVQPAIDATTRGIFVPDHGHYSPPVNDNPNALHEFWGEPRTKWYGSKYPCCCVMGFCSGRDQPIVDEWVSRTRRLLDRLDLMAQVSFYDQGVFQDFIEMSVDDLANGTVWNDLCVRRQSSVKEVLNEISRQDTDRVVLHYGGIEKPWYWWPKEFTLGPPK